METRIARASQTSHCAWATHATLLQGDGNPSGARARNKHGHQGMVLPMLTVETLLAVLQDAATSYGAAGTASLSTFRTEREADRHIAAFAAHTPGVTAVLTNDSDFLVRCCVVARVAVLCSCSHAPRPPTGHECAWSHSVWRPALW